MDKLTAIKIKYDDGTYSDEIPLSVLSENVEWDNTHTLVDVLGSIDVDITGTIQDQITQLFNSKVNATDLSSYVNSTMKTEVATWLNNYISPATGTIAYDASLSIYGAAADAKATGQIVQISTTQPTKENNRIWVGAAEEEYEVLTEDDLTDLKDDINNTFDIESITIKSYNYFDKSKYVENSQISNSGGVSSSNSYCRTGLIPLPEDKTKLYAFASNGTYIGGANGGMGVFFYSSLTEQNTSTFVQRSTPAVSGFTVNVENAVAYAIRFNLSNIGTLEYCTSLVDGLMLVARGDYPTPPEYTEYGWSEIEKEYKLKKDCLPEHEELSPNEIWKNKKVSWYGDSITANGAYKAVLNTYYGWNATNNGVGGTRISEVTTGQTPSAMCTLTRMQGQYSNVYDENTGETTANGVAIPTDVELIVVMGGTNDFSQNVALGTKALTFDANGTLSVDDTTFYGACHMMFKNLCTLFPNAEIICLGTPYGRKVSAAHFTDPYGITNTQGLTSVQYGDALCDVAGMWGIKSFNIGRLLGINETNVLEYSDGFHFNSEGSALMADELKNIFQSIHF